MQKELIISRLKQSKAKLKNQFHIAEIGLFGSYARETQDQDSDIDLIISLEEGKRLGFKELYDLEEYLKQLLDTDHIDIVNKRFINPIIESEMVKSVVYV